MPILLCGALHAANLHWDGETGYADGASSNSSTATLNWLSGGNWDDGTSSAPRSGWTAGDTATFGGTTTGQLVNLSSPISLGGLTFSSGGYTIAGSAITLASPTITANQPAIILSPLAGTAGLTKAGSSSLILGGTNTYSGTTTISGNTNSILWGSSLSSPGSFGNGGNISFSTFGYLGYLGAGETVARNIHFATVGGGGIDNNAANPGAGALRLTNLTAANASMGVTFRGGSNTVVDNGIPGDSTTLNFNKTGIGILTVNGEISGTGAIRAQGGVLELNGSTSNTRAIVGQRTLGSGGTVWFGPASAIRTTETGTGNMLGGWLVWNKTDWASGNGSQVTSFSGSYSTNLWASGANTLVSGSLSATDAPTQSLRFNGAGSGTVNLAGTAMIQSGGILTTANVGSGTSTITGGVVTAPLAVGDLIIHNFNTAGGTTINSVVGGVSKTGNFDVEQKIVTNLSSTTGLFAGMSVTGTGIPANSVIATVDSSTQITLNNNTTAAGSGTLLAFGTAIGVTASGPGTTTLGGSNNYTGATYVQGGGTLIVNANSGAKIYHVAADSKLYLGYDTGLSIYGFVANVWGSGVASSSGLYLKAGNSFTFQNSGGLNLKGAPTTVRAYTGTGSTATLLGWDVNFNQLTVDATASGSVIDSSVAINCRAYGYRIGTTVGPNSATGDLIVNSVIDGTGSNTNGGPYRTTLRKEGTGSLWLTAANTFVNGIYLNGGTIVLSGGDNRLNPAIGVIFNNGGVLALNGVRQTLADISVNTGTGRIVGRSSTLSTLTVNCDTDDTYSGTLGGPGTNENRLALVKSGVGTLTLSGPNTYTGSTTLEQGALRLEAGGTLPALSDLALNGGSLELNGSSQTVKSLTVGAGGGTIDFGALTGTNTLRVTNAVSSSWSGNLVIRNFESGVDHCFFGADSAGLGAQANRVTLENPVGYPAGNYFVTLNAAGEVLIAVAPVDFTFSNNGNGTVTVTGYTGSGGAVTIPDHLGGLPVTAIGNSAFESQNSLTSVTIPAGVVRIGDWAFASCSNLAAITIPSSVTEIGSRAFQSCSALASVTLPISVTIIGSSAFSGCSGLTNLVLSNGLTAISSNAFQGCNSLANVVIPPNVTLIGYGAFSSCRNLASVAIPASVTEISDYAFWDCTGLTTVTMPPTGVTRIGDWAFDSCSNLAAITIPSSVTEIGSRAFQSCSALTVATFLGNAPTSMGNSVFLGASPDFTVRYSTDKSGFSTPTWQGYPTVGVPPPAPPAITTHPASQTIFSGTSATLSVAVSGNPVPVYQWYRGISGDETNSISGATSADYTTPSLTVETTYWVKVSNPHGTVNSESCVVTVVPNPVPNIVIEQPQGRNLPQGEVQDFGSLLAGEDSAARDFTIRNSGSGPLGGLALSITGGEADQFILDQSGIGETLVAGGYASFSIKFRPTSAGGKWAALRIASNDPDSPSLEVPLFGAGLVAGQTTQVAYLKGSVSQTGTQWGCFAYSAAASGDTVVTGINTGSGIGSAEVFVSKNGVWVREAVLTPSNGQAGDWFGDAVAISGDTIVIGARERQGRVGAAYVFVRSNGMWSQQAYLTASNAQANNLFGASVGISGDQIVVGAPYRNSITGAAYVFERSGAVWSETAMLTASDAGPNSSFGHSVAISEGTVVVGAPNPPNGVSRGAAYVFIKQTGAWTQTSRLVASNADNGDHFGFSVAASGDAIAVGAPLEGGGATGVNGDSASNTITNSGAAYVFRRNLQVWTQEAYLKASNTGQGDQFGWSVALDGARLIVGAPAEASNARGIDGNGANNSSAGSGAAYTYLASGGVWQSGRYLKASNSDSGDAFGQSVAVGSSAFVVGAGLEGSASTFVNGSPLDNSLQGAGAAYVFVSTPLLEPPAIATQPVAQTIPYGTVAALSVLATGTEPLTYQWYLGTSGDVSAPVFGATGTSFTTPPLTVNTPYWVRATNSLGTADSDTALVVVLPPPAEIAVTQTNGMDFPSGSTLGFGNNMVEGSAVLQTLAVNNTGGLDLTNITLSIDGSAAADFPVNVAEFPASIAPGGSANLVIRFLPTGGGIRSARLLIASNDGDESPFTINLTGTGTAPPALTSHPSGVSVFNGTPATLSAAAAGYPTPTLQWYQGEKSDTSTPVAGATGGTLVTPPLTTTTSFWVRATNEHGSADSDAAVVTVIPSANADLASLAVSPGALAPAFDPAGTAYQVSLPNATNRITVTPVITHALATAKLRVNDGGYADIATGETSLPLAVNPGHNLIEIRVTAQNGSTKSYTIAVERDYPPMPDLTIGLSAPSTAVAGSPFGYTLAVANGGGVSAGGIGVRFTVPSGLSVVSAQGGGHGFAVASTSGGAVLFEGGSLGNGETETLSVTVVAASAGGIQAPTGAARIDFGNTVAESNELNNGSPGPVQTTVNPVDFAPRITSQPVAALTVESHTRVVVSAAAEGYPSPAFQWYRGTPGNTADPVAGAVSSTLDIPSLATSTTFWMRATNSSGHADSDAAVVTVTPSANANLANLAISSGTLTPSFSPAVTSYSVTLPNSTSALSLTASPANSGAVVTVNGGPVAAGSASAPIALSVGTNPLAVMVTAADGTTAKAYTVNVVRSQPAAVTTLSATDVGNTTATLRASVNPQGISSTVYFEYGSTTGYGIVSQGITVGGSSAQPVALPLSGLGGSTVYHFRAVVVGGGSTVYGGDQVFTTTATPPVAVTANPVAVNSTDATLTGAVNPNGLATTVHFEYGSTTLYGTPTLDQNIPAGTSLVDITAPVTGLTSGATYHCRIVAVSAAGTTRGADVVFTAGSGSGSGTGTATAPPVVATGGYAAVTASAAELLGYITANGGTTLARVEYGATTAYGQSSDWLPIGNGTEPAAVSFHVQELSSGTLYHYRVVAENSRGTVAGDDAVFTTAFPAPVVTTGTAAALTTTTTRVNGSVRARNADADVYIDYGTSPSLLSNSIAASPALVTGDSTTEVTALLTNLTQGTTYYYRVRAVNSGGTSIGGTGSFDVGLLSGLLQRFPDETASTDHQGSLTVDLTPAAVGVGWRFAGEIQWRASGSSANGLAPGDRVIEFRPLPGYLQPANETATLAHDGAPVVISRAYTATAAGGSGSLSVALKPDSLADVSVPAASRAQWRLYGEGDSQWKDSGQSLSNLPAGDYVIECKPVAGRVTPAPVGARVAEGSSTLATATYRVEQTAGGTPPQVVGFDEASANRERPYAYVGQLVSNAGLGSGFVVRQRVVATAGHVVFDDGTLATVSGLRWLFQRDRDINEPLPQTPRGFYLMTGYADRRTLENTPGTSAPESQNLDAAALYFHEDAGRGGYSGYLASDSAANEFIISPALKTLVGYPVDGIAPLMQGRVHATPVADVPFTPAFGQTYVTTAIRSSGGGSGGPLCVQYNGGAYYPAAIYLGGTAQTVVRAIDGAVVDLFGFAEAAGNAAIGNSGGTVTDTSVAGNESANQASLRVVIEPADARTAGAGWKIRSLADYAASGTHLDGLTPDNYTINFASVAGFLPPAPQPVALTTGSLTTVTYTYERLILPPVITSSNTATGTRGHPLSYQITATNSPAFYSLLGMLPAGMSFQASSGLISGTPQEAGDFAVTVSATNAGGSDSRVVHLNSRPVISSQSVTAPYETPFIYQIVSGESGTGVAYTSGALPAGLLLDAATGVISGTPGTPGVFDVTVTVLRAGASASANLQLTITGAAPSITQQPPAEKSVEYGLTTTLSVSVTGTPPPSLQWFEGASGVTDHPVWGANAATFVTPPVTATTRYWVRASSISGTADSTETVVRPLPSTNAKLAYFSLSSGQVSPWFNPDITAYTASVPYGVTLLNITPQVQVAQSSVTVNGFAVSNNTASPALPLVVGSNSIIVSVTAGDGVTTRHYQVSVTRAPAPVAATDDATHISDVSAVLHGTVLPNSPVSAYFQYGTTTQYGGVTPVRPLDGATAVPLSFDLGGLTGNTTYHYRMVAVTGAGDFFGEDRVFNTLLERPLAATGGTANVSTSAATLIGAVHPKGLPTTAYFQYGTTTAYGLTTPLQTIPAGGSVVDVPTTITQLTPSAVYHFRLVATNDAGTAYGADMSFSAISGGGSGDGVVDGPPVVATGSTGDLTSTTATLLGTANPRDGTTFAWFEYGSTPELGSVTAGEGIGNGNEPAGVTHQVAGLVPGTRYYYRLAASNSLGTVFGDIASFVAIHNPPVVSTGTAEALTTTSARLHGTVNARGTTAEVFFDFGTDGVNFPESVRATQATVAGETDSTVNAVLTSLNGALTYYYKVRATSNGGSASGDVKTLQLGSLLGLRQEFTNTVASGEAQGSVKVNLTPSGTGAWRFTGETAWRASGTTATGLATGERVIEFQPVAGQIQPQTETVGIVSGDPTLVLDRVYYESAAPGAGTLRVLLSPESVSSPTVPLASRTQWRIVGDADTTWRDSSAERAGIMSGSYLVECKPVPGKGVPAPVNVFVSPGGVTTAAIAYPPAVPPSLYPPVVVPFATTSTSENLPYAYVGQVRSGTGMYSGFVVKPRVVATAAQSVFDEATLAAASGVQWLLQRDAGTYEPDPLVPRGFYQFDGYASQRASEATPGTLSLASQNLNVAALYFAADAGRGGFSGFLASDSADNEYLKSTASKTLVGYPVSGIAASNQGRMQATPPLTASFSLATGRTFVSSVIRGLGGMAGGPLCVQYQGASYYPAGIYVGGTTQGSVRAIDGPVIDLFGRAEVSGNGGDNNTGGGITQSSFTSIGSTTDPGAIKVTIEPAAAAAVGGWLLRPETSFRSNNAQKNGLKAGSYVIEFKTIPGYQTPASQTIVVTGGQLAQLTYTYESALTALQSWRLANFGTSDPTGPAADTADPDGDGQPNISEYTAGTRPNDASDVFRILTTQKTSTSFTVTAAGKAGRSYVLERITDLPSGSWAAVSSSDSLQAAGTVTLTDPQPPGGAAFYRVRVNLP